MKLSDIILNYNQLSAATTDATYPVHMSFAISHNLEILQAEAEKAEKERIKLCEMYADKDEDGKAKTEDGSYVISPDNKKDMEIDYAELMAEEIDLDIRKITESDIEKCDSSERYTVPTLAMLKAMEFMIER